MSIGDWDNFAVVTGGASAALTGLLFVAVSLRADRIGSRHALRAKASQTLMLFVVPLLLSLVVVTPGQPRWVFGAELTALGLAAGVALARSEVSAHSPSDDVDSELARLLDRRGATLVTTLLMVVGGITLIVGHSGGLYWLVPAVLVALVTGVLNAWLFLVSPGPAAAGAPESGG